MAGVALASEWTKEGKIGEITIHPTWSYDEFRLAGDPNVCGTGVDSAWRNRIRYYHTDGGAYDAVTKALLSAKLSGARVSVTAENNSENKCVLKHLDILE